MFGFDHTIERVPFHRVSDERDEEINPYQKSQSGQQEHPANQVALSDRNQT
jgi:hypothetical protein